MAPGHLGQTPLRRSQDHPRCRGNRALDLVAVAGGISGAQGSRGHRISGHQCTEHSVGPGSRGERDSQEHASGHGPSLRDQHPWLLSVAPTPPEHRSPSRWLGGQRRTTSRRRVLALPSIHTAVSLSRTPRKAGGLDRRDHRRRTFLPGPPPTRRVFFAAIQRAGRRFDPGPRRERPRRYQRRRLARRSQMGSRSQGRSHPNSVHSHPGPTPHRLVRCRWAVGVLGRIRTPCRDL